MPILTQKAALLAAVELDNGTPVATSASNAILVADPMWAIESEEIVRNFTRGDFSTYQSVFVQRRATLTFKTEVRGSGTTAVAPDWAVLLRGCGFLASPQALGAQQSIAAGPTGLSRNLGGDIVTVTPTAPHSLVVGDWVSITGTTPTSGTNTFNGVFQVATVNGSTSFTIACPGTASQTGGGGTMARIAGALYRPRTSGLESLTMRLYWDGILHVLSGAMGTWKLTAEAGNIGMIEWTFTGNYTTPSNAAFPAQTLQNLIPPIVGNLDLAWASSASFLYAGNLDIDWGNQIALRKDVNSLHGMAGVYISGRNPTGRFTPEVSTALNTSFMSDWETARTRALSAEFGNTNGNRVLFSSAAAQITGVAYGDRDNIRTYDISLGFRRVTGDDEMRILFQ